MHSPLSALTDAALRCHAHDPQAAADRLADALPLLAQADGGDIEAWLRAAEHVLLGHLARPAQLREWVTAAGTQWPRHPALGGSLQRIEAAMALAEGHDALLDGLDPAERVRAHYNALLACTRRGELGNARLLMELATARAALFEHDNAAQRALAALCNNTAADLREHFPASAPQAMALMIDAATRARVAWSRAGGWLEIERADWQLAMCLAYAGQGEDALVHAQAALRACEAEHADAFEVCFAWQAMAHAALAAHDLPQARHARAEMAARREHLTHADDQAELDRCLAWLDARLG